MFCVIVLVVAGLVSYKVNSSYAVFTDSIRGSKVIELEVALPAKPLDTSGANTPVLSENMIPVYYDGDTWRKADSANLDETYKWYDYNNKMWANAVTVSSANRDTYKSAKPGTEISMNDINTMLVWIPRYTYTVWNYNLDGTVGSEPQEIQIEFEEGTSSGGEITCEDNIQGTSDGTSSGTEPTTSETCKLKSSGAKCTDDTCNGKKYTHPAFTFGDKELTGFWVGKFEVSSDITCTAASSSAIGSRCNLTTIKPLVKPDVTSWQGAMVGTFENNMMAMNDTDNIYGFLETDDTHMIKNIEWGAVAYLSHSKYGTCTNGECTEISINDSGSSGGGGFDGQSNDITTQEITGTFLSTTSCTTTLTGGCDYKTNIEQSTTGNIYGVYDMSGGSDEYVMANIVSPDGTTMMSGYGNSGSYPNAHSGYSGILYYDGTTFGAYGTFTGYYGNYPEDKYYDKYSFNTSAVTISRSKLGDGIREVFNTLIYGWNTWSDGWYDDDSLLASSDIPWFFRGGDYLSGSIGGVFFLQSDYGYSEGGCSSRLVISQ